MKKSLISFTFFFIIIGTLGFYMNNTKKQVENLFILKNNLIKIMTLNKDFDIYLKNTLQYDNFDIIEFKIELFQKNLSVLNNNILNNSGDALNEILVELNSIINSKFKIIDKVKSYRAILNNSFRIIQKIKNQKSNKLNNIYTTIMTIDKNPEIDINNELVKINNVLSNKTLKYDRLFLTHTRIILQYYIKLHKLSLKLNNLRVNNKLEKLNELYEYKARKNITKAQVSVGVLFVLLIISIILYLLKEYKLIISNKELYKFRKTVENSDNIVVITDNNETIKYVNEEFTKVTGYTCEEAIGKHPSILKSGKQSKEFYDNLKNTIHSGQKWSGEFINKNKYGELSFEKASITPVIDDEGNIEEFIAIKLDITNERVAEQQLKENEKLLIQQSKMAALGEMLENIAHQWRQPLSVISTLSTGIIMRKDLGIYSEEKDIENLNKINDMAQFLSRTIDDFRDFFKPNKQKIEFSVKDIYLKALSMIDAKFKSLEIQVIENIQNITIVNFDNELIQVLINIFNNAKDILIIKDIRNKMIFIDIYKIKNYIIIEIKDNAGGVEEKIINKIFEPYFTTKHKSQGTGIGLYMSQEMISKHMNGELSVINSTYKYQSQIYTGAVFKIKLKLNHT